MSDPAVTEAPKQPGSELRNMGPAGRMATMGMPAEKSRDFGGSSRRLLSQLRPERFGAIMGVVLALGSVTLSVLGPRILGHGTDIIFKGLNTRDIGIDFHGLRNVLLGVLVLYIASAALSLLQSFTLAKVVQRTMYRLRADVEDKLNRLSLSYVDSQPRGDMLSRVTNDIDNISQSMQQSLSMVLTSTLSLVGVVIMMYIISPVLASVAVVTIPL